MNNYFMIAILLSSIVAILIGLLISRWVVSLSPGNESMREIDEILKQNKNVLMWVIKSDGFSL